MMVFEENDGGVDNHKYIPHSKRCDLYMNEKKELIRGRNYVEVSGFGGKKVFLGVVYDHVVEEVKEHDEIGLRGFDFYSFGKY